MVALLPANPPTSIAARAHGGIAPVGPTTTV